jgi:hypothetical protein
VVFRDVPDTLVSVKKPKPPIVKGGENADVPGRSKPGHSERENVPRKGNDRRNLTKLSSKFSNQTFAVRMFRVFSSVLNRDSGVSGRTDK